jgi:hypothetical protein
METYLIYFGDHRCHQRDFETERGMGGGDRGKIKWKLSEVDTRESSYYIIIKLIKGKLGKVN